MSDQEHHQTRIEEQQMFLERDVEQLSEQTRILLDRIENLSARLARMENRLDGLLELPFEEDLDGLKEIAPDELASGRTDPN